MTTANLSRGAAVRACLALAALTAGALPAAAQLPVGPPLELNVDPPCQQALPAALTLASGDVAIAWINGPHVWARILGWPGPAGQPLSDGIELNDVQPLGLYPAGVALAPAPGGGFYAAWWGRLFEPVLAPSLVLRAFDAAGQPLGDPVEAVGGGPTIFGAAIATDPEGQPAVVWRDEPGALYLRLFESDLAPRGGLIVIAGQAPDQPRRGDTPALAFAADGTLLIAWGAPLPGETTTSGPSRVLVRRVNASGSPQGGAYQVNDLPIDDYRVEPALAALDGGGFAVLWNSWDGPEAAPGVYARLLDADGMPSGDGFAVTAVTPDYAAAPAVAALAGGGFLASWSAIPVADPQGYQAKVYLRTFGPGGEPGGPELAVPEAEDEARQQLVPTVTADAAGHALVAWSQQYPFPPILPPPCSEAPLILAQPLLLGCTPTDSRLCLQGGRFSIEVTVDDPRLDPSFPRPAGADPLTADTGTFWFFRPANVELMVKVLDGRAVNDRFWFFSGALTNVGHEIVVTDTLTGEERRYVNLPGELTSRADTDAFSDPPPPPSAPAIGALPPLTSAAPAEATSPPRPVAGATHPTAPCTEPTILCLQSERIQVRLEWSDPRSGDSGSAVAVPLSDESGWFWFFRPDNAEVVVKVLNAWPISDNYWVFYGGLTDLEFTLSVEDVVGHTAKTYHKPPFTLTSFADTVGLPGPFPCPICSAAAPASTTRSADGDGKP